MRVLVFTPYLPHAAVGHGGGTAVREMVRALAARHDLHLLTLRRPGEERLVDAVAADLGCTLHSIPFPDRNARGVAYAGLLIRRAAAGLRGLLRGFPYYVEKYWSPSLSKALIRAVERVEPDVVQIEYLQNALLTRDLRRWRDASAAAGGPAPRIFASTHELGSTPRERRAAVTGNPLLQCMLRHQAQAWHRLQTASADWADHTFCVTDDDRAVLEARGVASCSTMPLGVNTAAVTAAWAPTSPPTLLFVGSFEHEPNREAVDFLIDKVWSTVAKYRKDAVLEVVGRGSRRHLRRRGDGDPRIRAHGFVDELDGFYRRCRLFVAPLTVGGGIKIKILEAMAHGVPVVTTPIGAEGIVVPEDDAAWIAPADDFAETVLSALDDDEGASRKAGRARRLIEGGFSWEAIADRMTQTYGRR